MLFIHRDAYKATEFAHPQSVGPHVETPAEVLQEVPDKLPTTDAEEARLREATAGEEAARVAVEDRAPARETGVPGSGVGLPAEEYGTTATTATTTTTTAAAATEAPVLYQDPERTVMTV